MLNCSFVTVSKNDIIGGSTDQYVYISDTMGILLIYCQNNSIHENYVLCNTYNIALQNSSNNLFYHNIFFTSTNQTITLEFNSNVWDNGEEGNYWSDYSGTDTNADGIGDTPYVIDDNNTDHYPLMCSSSSFDAGEWTGTEYEVSMTSNSTVSNFQINTAENILSFNVTGAESTTGFTVITIPNVIVQTMWQNNFMVMIDGQPCNFTRWADAENTYIFVRYTHSEHEITIVQADVTPPVTADDYDDSWHTSEFTITLTATDDLSDIAEIHYKINDGITKTVSADGQPLITTEGSNNKLEYWTVDTAGNEETHHVLTGIKLDKTASSGSVVINSGQASTTSTSVTLTLTATDDTSGIYQVRYSNDGSSWSSWESPSTTKAWTLSSGDGTKSVHYQIMDNAGIISQTYSDTITLTSSSSDSGSSSSTDSSSSNTDTNPTPSPSPSPSPTPSPTPTPTPSTSPEPTKSPSPPPEETPLFIYAIVVAAAFAAIGVAMFMLKKKR